jgi:NitT/TauT family transport system ATP-binding protein
MIEVRNLSISYGDEAALQNVNFSLRRGNSCAVIGASGCGKTTLLLALAGLIKPDEGQIIIDGNNLNCTREKTGLVLQDYGLLPWKARQ